MRGSLRAAGVEVRVVPPMCVVREAPQLWWQWCRAYAVWQLWQDTWRAVWCGVVAACFVSCSGLRSSSHSSGVFLRVDLLWGSAVRTLVCEARVR